MAAIDACTDPTASHCNDPKRHLGYFRILGSRPVSVSRNFVIVMLFLSQSSWS